MTLSELWLFVFSLVGLSLVPAALGRAAWAVPAGFAAVGLFLLLAPAGLHPAHNRAVLALLSQAPWMLLVLDLAARGRVERILAPVSVRALLALALFRFMGFRYVFAALSGDLPPDFALEAAGGELFTALGAGVLWAIYRPEKTWYRGLLIFWNTYGLMTALALSFRILRSDRTFGSLPPAAFGEPSRELHGFFLQWPHAWEPFFWIPLAISIHAAIFFKTLRGPSLPSRSRGSVGTSGNAGAENLSPGSSS